MGRFLRHLPLQRLYRSHRPNSTRHGNSPHLPRLTRPRPATRAVPALALLRSGPVPSLTYRRALQSHHASQAQHRENTPCTPLTTVSSPLCLNHLPASPLHPPLSTPDATHRPPTQHPARETVVLQIRAPRSPHERSAPSQDRPAPADCVPRPRVTRALYTHSQHPLRGFTRNSPRQTACVQTEKSP